MKKTSTVDLDLGQQIEELTSRKQAAEQALADQQAAEHARLIADPNERRARLAVLLARDKREDFVKAEILRLEQALKAPEQNPELYKLTLEQRVARLEQF